MEDFAIRTQSFLVWIGDTDNKPLFTYSATRTETSESLVTRTRHPTTRSPPTTPISTTTATIVLPACDKLFDVIFVMDSSQSINAPQYNKEKEFVKMLAKVVNVGNGSRASVIIYSDKAQLKIRFGQHENLDSFKEEVDSLPYLQQRTRIDKALTMAAQVLKLARYASCRCTICFHSFFLLAS